jgi:hypothetical protein
MTRTKALFAASFALSLMAGAGHGAPASDRSANDPANPVNGAQPLRIASGPGQEQTTYQSKPRVVTDQTAPPAQIRALAAGYNRLVTNGPIPDTPANRARYGKPLSHAGRQSAPDGN